MAEQDNFTWMGRPVTRETLTPDLAFEIINYLNKKLKEEIRSHGATLDILGSHKENG